MIGAFEKMLQFSKTIVSLHKRKDNLGSKCKKQKRYCPHKEKVNRKRLDGESLREVQTALDPRLDFTTAWVGAFKERAKPLAQVSDTHRY